MAECFEIKSPFLEQLHQITEEGLIKKIYNVGPVRARLMKNAATVELLEYLSG
jgi:hypothetical protein